MCNGDRSFANGNGESGAGCPAIMPLWLRGNVELAMARAAQYSSWTVQA